MSHAVGSLVRARGREWVVLPDSSDDLLMVRPLGGTEDEVTGLVTALEDVRDAHFDLPDPSKVGDHRSCRLLRDAIRLGFRSSAGPFRSFGKIAVEPRPYQLVPLLVALKQDPIRILIADDTGIGKTVEAALIARELMDRGEVTRLAVLCPPHLAEQWQAELRDKFHIDAELVLASTATRLERGCAVGQSLFDLHPHVVVSSDFIKSDRRRDEFLRTCPELVIVDEAHTCAFEEGHGGRHQRWQLVRGVAAKPDRHLILVTAVPHSGKEGAFRSLLAFLKSEFAHLPEDLSGKENEHHRRHLAQHLVQRRRGDIRHYMATDTPFPERADAEATYKLSPDYRKLFERVLDYTREIVKDPQGNRHRQRVRWWSALALLRSLGSSPAAAAATLRNRASTLGTETPEEADEIGRNAVLDQDATSADEVLDVSPGGNIAELDEDEQRTHRRLMDMAREADALCGENDAKLLKAVDLIRQLLKDGHRPIVFCRFIPTADYLAEQLRERLKKVEVVSVTGTLPPAEREERIAQLVQAPQRVLVCTDCLSEGINLQDHFDAVMHYDLSWNPTRHEQREGRVDRYGQVVKKVCVLTYYGIDNQIDGIVLDVLLRKHRTIRSSLGISVPVPVDTNQVIEALFEGLLLRQQSGPATAQLQLFEDFFKPQKEDLHRQWDAASEREKRSRTMFAQEAISSGVEELVKRELEAARAAVGSGTDVKRFTIESLRAHGASVSEDGRVSFNVREVPRALRDAMGVGDAFKARFELPIGEDEIHLSRTHPIVEAVATHVLDTALDPLESSIANRCGAIRTKAVATRTTLLLVRLRFHIVTQSGDAEEALLAEDWQLLGFTGAPKSAKWLKPDEAEALLDTKPSGNIAPEQARDFVRRVIDGIEALRPHLDEAARLRGQELLEAHHRVRQAIREKGVHQRVEPHLPSDILGIYVYLPASEA